VGDLRPASRPVARKRVEQSLPEYPECPGFERWVLDVCIDAPGELLRYENLVVAVRVEADVPLNRLVDSMRSETVQVVRILFWRVPGPNPLFGVRAYAKGPQDESLDLIAHMIRDTRIGDPDLSDIDEYPGFRRLAWKPRKLSRVSKGSLRTSPTRAHAPEAFVMSRV
jgi:hypothetical protein